MTIRKSIVHVFAIAVVFGSALVAQDLTGNWQGTLHAGIRDLRLIVAFDKTTDGKWNAALRSIDQGPDWGSGIAADTVTLQGSDLKFAIAALRGSYEGKLSADGASFKGTWTQGLPLPLELRRATPDTEWKDPSPHTAQFVTVDTIANKPVSLEVLDWGGSGRTLVLLAGLGNTAHIYDKFALKLTPAYHVYAITRRGFGASSAPVPEGAAYSADRLGDDVLAVLGALKVNRPVLAGHSLGGEELSSIGTRHPEKVAGLIYLDAGYAYAFYDKSLGDPLAPPASAQLPSITAAIMSGEQKYTDIRGPVLAIYAFPHDTGQPFKDDAERAAAEKSEEAIVGAQVKAFEKGVPSARVVRLPHANHYVFVSNEADVLREMQAFIGKLP